VSTLQRMIQYREKAKTMSVREGPRAALLSYPLLQAADVLIYKGTDVPVGYDQTQHLEQIADVARRFNCTFEREYFQIPTAYQSSSPSVRSLRDPSKKMSKSDRSDSSRIELSDSREDITEKVKRAFTDSDAHLVPISFDPERRPGVSNLIRLHSYFSHLSPEEVVQTSEGMKIKEFKERLTNIIVEAIEPIRTSYVELMKDEHRLREILKTGNQQARDIARRSLAEVKEIVGLA